MEDESAWTVYHLNSDIEAEYEFNFTDDTPSAGSGGCLWVAGETTNEINILFWQEVTFVGGATYTISGAFKDMTGGALDQFWCDVVLSPEAPVEGVNYRPPNDTNGDIRVSMNTWASCGSGTDGTFQDDGCSGSSAEYTLPDSFDVGEKVTYYFGVKPGVYAGGPLNSFEILIDEMSLIGPPATGIEKNDIGVIDQFSLYPNFPNPFNPTTEITYSLKKQEDISLKIYNISGQLVRILVDKRQIAGEYTVQWDGLDDLGDIVSNGIYLYRMQAGNFTRTRKMVLHK
jgi:hypothetical protein